MLCAKGAQALQTKSMVVEEASNELINMLCTMEIEEEEEEKEREDEDEGIGKGDNCCLLSVYIICTINLCVCFSVHCLFSYFKFFKNKNNIH